MFIGTCNFCSLSGIQWDYLTHTWFECRTDKAKFQPKWLMHNGKNIVYLQITLELCILFNVAIDLATLRTCIIIQKWALIYFFDLHCYQLLAMGLCMLICIWLVAGHGEGVRYYSMNRHVLSLIYGEVWALSWFCHTKNLQNDLCFCLELWEINSDSDLLIISHMTWISWYPQVWISSWSFKIEAPNDGDSK